jgi:hypothetical protein
MLPTLFILILLASIWFGLSLIAIGGHLWLAAKKRIVGAILLTVGLIMASAPMALIVFFTITTNSRG